ncbi:hypothetical protein J27TS8_19580 [Robertmurraya siralis]|uniref:Spo0E like sporulation regulatory protein n=1 Tax=Robertmurraya siralis TaxID=77777 RepID=A0A919WH94_9BACI|nr:aspartyl-phosphate phosphatase Spo0E family protein [Robertmurraya siralis]GIN61965.1 hypothetical protein J27TS8_19580 [Robertmurraya siralis]
MSRSCLEESLFYKIETLRKEMIRTGIKEGLSSKNTIQLSQMLDQYVLQYQKLNFSSFKKNF